MRSDDPRRRGPVRVAYGSRKLDYSLASSTLGGGSARAKGEERILAKAGSTRISEAMFSIEWQFRSGEGELESVVEEVANDVLCDSAYPESRAACRALIAR